MFTDPLPPFPGDRGTQILIRTVLRKRLRGHPSLRRVWDVVCRWCHGESRAQIIRTVSRAHGVSEETVQRDIGLLIDALPGFCFSDPTRMIDHARAEARARTSFELCAGALVLMLMVRDRLGLDAATDRVGCTIGLSLKSIETGFWGVIDLM